MYLQSSLSCIVIVTVDGVPTTTIGLVEAIDTVKSWLHSNTLSLTTPMGTQAVVFPAVPLGKTTMNGSLGIKSPGMAED